jgi:hypothetical protein
MKKAIDEELHALEQRMALRRHEIAGSARAARTRAVRKLVSPGGLAAAAGLGFLLSYALLRKRGRPVADRRRAPKPNRLGSLLHLAMPLALGIVRSQFGGPAGLAQHVLEKFRKSPSPRGDVPPAHVPPRTHVPPRSAAQSTLVRLAR